MNRTLKEAFLKLSMETGGDGVALLPFTLCQALNALYTLRLMLFEIMLG